MCTYEDIGGFHMTREERLRNRKKERLCKKLGAEQFQQVVFFAERIKWKVIKKYFPKYLKRCDRKCNKHQRREIKKAKTEEEILAIKRKYKMIKMNIRQEYIQEKNCNYHLNNHFPTDALPYLEWNKKMHVTGLKRDIAVATVLTGLALSGVGFVIPLIGLPILSSGLNFQCINLQNYSICRYKRNEDYIQRKEQRAIKQRIEQYAEPQKSIAQTLEQKEDFSLCEENEAQKTLEEVIQQIKSKRQGDIMKEYLMNYIKEREAKNKGREKCRVY